MEKLKSKGIVVVPSARDISHVRCDTIFFDFRLSDVWRSVEAAWYAGRATDSRALLHLLQDSLRQWSICASSDCL